MDTSLAAAGVQAQLRAKYGTRFDGFIFHCPLPMRVTNNPFHPQWFKAIDDFFADPDTDGTCTDPENLTILTYNTRPEVSLLERNAARLGLEKLVVLGRGREGWSWWYKIDLVREYLASGTCTTDYVLCIDADDVMIVSDPARIVPAFLSTDCDVLFCGTRGNQPPSDACWDFENQTYPSADPMHRHLNACFIGKRDVLHDCLEQIAKGYHANADWCDHDGAFDDQLAWRHLHMWRYPSLKVDVDCRLFLRFDEDR